jgi:alkyl hydroperoxide reductase subunit AhpC
MCTQPPQTCNVAKIGAPTPSFKGQAVIPLTEFVDISLEQFKGQWLVLFSYPLDFTFVCPTEIIAFRAINCEVVGMSTDSVYS